LNALDTFTSQRTFRALLTACAHPGRLVTLPDEVLTTRPAPLAVPLALADLGHRVAVVGTDSDRWGAHLTAATSCPLVPAEHADLVVVLDGPTASLVGTLRRGSALAPEQGCRLVVACTLDGDGGVSLALRGPGVPSVTNVRVGGVPRDVFEALADANRGFPAGIDTFLVTEGGHVAALPRSTTLEVH